MTDQEYELLQVRKIVNSSWFYEKNDDEVDE